MIWAFSFQLEGSNSAVCGLQEGARLFVMPYQGVTSLQSSVAAPTMVGRCGENFDLKFSRWQGNGLPDLFFWSKFGHSESKIWLSDSPRPHFRLKQHALPFLIGNLNSTLCGALSRGTGLLQIHFENFPTGENIGGWVPPPLPHPKLHPCSYMRENYVLPDN